MKSLLIRFWPVIFIIAVWFTFAHPYFIKGRVPYSATYQVNFFAPWSHYEANWGPVKNNAMPDVHTQIYPWKKFTIDTYKMGQVPFWNPNSFAGNPHLANYQSAVFSPFNLLFFVLPFIDAWSVMVLLQPLLAGLFMYLFVRALGLSRIGALIASVAFMFCGFIVVWMAYGTLAYAILYLPLAFFAIERYIQTKQKKSLLLLALTIPLSFFSGHFQISFYFFAVTLVYAVFKIVTAKKQALLTSLLLAIFVGLLLSLPQLLPSIELYRQAVRSELFQIGEVVPLQYLVTSFAPDFFGNPVTRNDWFGHYAEWASFIGIVPFILALYAIVRRKGIFFTLLGIAALVLAVKSPVSSFIVSLKIPVISTSALSRIIVLFSFAAAVLAAFGFDQLQKDLKDRRAVKKILPVFATVGGLLIFLWGLLLIGKVYPIEWIVVAKRNLVLPTGFFVLTSALLFLVRFQPKSSLLIAYLLLLIASFDSFRFAQKWMPFDPKNLVYPDVPLAAAIKNNIGDGRVFGNLGAEVGSYYGIELIEGYDPLYIDRYGEFLVGAVSGKYEKAQRSVATLARNGKYTDRVLELLGVTLVFQPIADTGQGWAYPVWDKEDRYALIYKDDKFELYKSNKALPRASLFYTFEVVKDQQKLLTRFYSDDFNFRKTVLLEEDLGISLKEGTGSATIVQYTPNKITIHVQTTEQAVLFIADNFYPGWKAAVNNKEEKIYRADYTFRAVVVPQGESTVEFTYKPL